MKIVFMGTPEFAAGSLQALIDAGHDILLVVTQPDREKGRGKKVAYSAVKECALLNNLPVFQPERIKTEEAIEELKKYEADIYVVAAFGQILSKEILGLPRLGCINVHASLLPKYRGAAPIQWSIIDGEIETGVTIMRMDVGLDTGDMVSSVAIPIGAKETGDSLHDRLMEAGAKLLVDTLPSIEDGSAVYTPQDGSLSCYAKMLNKNMGRLDFSDTCHNLDRLIRGLNSWPGAFTTVEGKTLKVWDVEPVFERTGKLPGTVCHVDKKGFGIATGDGYLKVNSVQLEGKKRMDVADFLRGFAIEEGMVLPS